MQRRFKLLSIRGVVPAILSLALISGVTLVSAVTVVSALTMASPVMAEEAAGEVSELPLNFSALAVNMSNVGPRGQARLNGRVTRWTTAEERATLVEALSTGGRRSLANALNRLDIVGFVRESTSLAENFRYARRVPLADGGQQIIMATDRPLAWAEVRRNTRTMSYNVTIVVLNLDKDGQGEGSLMMGAELTLNDEKDQLVIEHFASEPIRLTSVRLR